MEIQLPEFDSSTLQHLTKRIEGNLKKPIEQSPRAPRLPRVKREKKPKTTDQQPREVPSVAVPSFSGGKRQDAGKKRRSDTGQPKRPSYVKSNVNSNVKSNVNSIKLGSRPESHDSISKSRLEEEVLALGGEKEDFELILDAGSESEMEEMAASGTDGLQKNFKKDLHRLVMDLGIKDLDKRELSSSSEGEEQELREVERTSTALQTHVSPSIKIATESQPRNVTAKGSYKLHLEPQAAWHSVALPPIPSQILKGVLPDTSFIDMLHQHAKSLLEIENTQYAHRNKSASSAHQFYSTIMSSGTLSDKISALTLSVQESPAHNMKALDGLIGLARKRSRGQTVEVLGALKDLLAAGALLPSDRKLKTFATQPGVHAAFAAHAAWTPQDKLPTPLTEAHLMSWAYEDWLKSKYFEMIQILETRCSDEVIFARVKAIDYVYELLRDKPEQEANLLRLLVNKLGDTNKKIASRTSYNILQLEAAHPRMKSIILGAIESDVIFRPGQSLHAIYYATITLNQTVLSGREEEVVKKLLDLYFSLFVKLLEKPKTKKPLATRVDETMLNKKGEVQGGGGTPGKKALRKATTQEKGTAPEDDVREKILSAVLTGVNRALPFTSTNDEAFEKHLDTLFRVTHSSNFNTSIQALMLIQQLTGSHLSSRDRFYRTLYESLLDPRLLTSSKQTLYLNVLFKALRSDLSIKRVKAFAKRLLQVVAMHQAPFAIGVLYLLRELEGVFPSLKALVDEPEADDNDEVENFQDVQDETDGDASPREHTERKSAGAGVQNHDWSSRYDPRKRDPQFSNADKSCLWELTPLLLNFDPAVALFASKLANHELMPAKPDLSSHTVTHFLDRFIHKNPKSAAKLRGDSIMQPMARTDSSAFLVSTRVKAATQDSVHSEAFWRSDISKVNANEVFFHKYFNIVGQGKDQAWKKKEKRKADKAGSDEEDGEDEDEIWKALVNSRPDLEGSEPSEDEMDMDMDDDDSASEPDEGGMRWEKEKTGSGEVGSESDEVLFDDDDEALVGSDEEVPSDVDNALGEEVKVSGETPSQAMEESKRSKKRRKLKNLPTFASADDYAELIGDDDE